MQTNETPLISLITPVYNGEKYLARCLDSLRAQDYPRLEFIVVDDGSTDNSPRILRQYAARDRRFRCFRQENAGQSAARNRALQLSRGEFIGFVDADDYAEPGLVSQLYRNLRENEADIACCAFWTEGKEHRLAPLPDRVLSMEEAYTLLVENRDLKHFLWNKLFRRSVIEGIKMPEDRIFEDIVFLTSCLARCRKFSLLSQPLYHYCENTESSSRTLSLEKRFQFVLATHEEQLFGLERGILPLHYRTRILKRSIHLANRLLLQKETPYTNRLLQRTLHIMHAYDGMKDVELSTALRRRLLYRHLNTYRKAYRLVHNLHKKKN